MADLCKSKKKSPTRERSGKRKNTTVTIQTLLENQGLPLRLAWAGSHAIFTAEGVSVLPAGERYPILTVYDDRFQQKGSRKKHRPLEGDEKTLFRGILSVAERVWLLPYGGARGGGSQLFPRIAYLDKFANDLYDLRRTVIIFLAVPRIGQWARECAVECSSSCEIRVTYQSISYTIPPERLR